MRSGLPLLIGFGAVVVLGAGWTLAAPEKPSGSLVGDVAVDGRQLCSIDSSTAKPEPWGIVDKAEQLPEDWVQVSPHPAIVVTLAEGSSAKFTILGPGDALVRLGMHLEARPESPVPTYDVRFGGPLPAGKYEFGGYEGRRPVFFRCGFTVTP